MNLSEYLITCTAEEAGEIALEILKTLLATQKVCSKTLRFGLDDRNVLDPTGPTNRERLVDELNDIHALAEMMADAGIIPIGWLDPEKVEEKRRKVAKFIGYAIGTGALDSPLAPAADPVIEFCQVCSISLSGQKVFIDAAGTHHCETCGETAKQQAKPIPRCTHGVQMDQHCPRCRHIPAVEPHHNPRQG